jgi:hypothetical protein
MPTTVKPKPSLPAISSWWTRSSSGQYATAEHATADDDHDDDDNTESRRLHDAA